MSWEIAEEIRIACPDTECTDHVGLEAPASQSSAGIEILQTEEDSVPIFERDRRRWHRHTRSGS
jgi:hypothetical protein